MKRRRRFDKKFKLEVGQRSLEGVTLKQLSQELVIHANSISLWRRQYLDVGEQLRFPGKDKEVQPEDQKEIRRLKKELAEAQLNTEILKKAICIFSKSDEESMHS